MNGNRDQLTIFCDEAINTDKLQPDQAALNVMFKICVYSIYYTNNILGDM